MIAQVYQLERDHHLLRSWDGKEKESRGRYVWLLAF